MIMEQKEFSYWKHIGKQFLKHRIGTLGLIIVIAFCLMGVFAPFLASSKPLVIVYNGELFFPLFRYLFFKGFYTKKIDLFFNLMILTLPLFSLALFLFRKRLKKWKWLLAAFILIQFFSFLLLTYFPLRDPASDPDLMKKREEALKALRQEGGFPSWSFELKYMNPYGKLNQVLRYRQLLAQHKKIVQYGERSMNEKLEKWLQEKEQIKRDKMIQKGVSKKDLPSSSELRKEILAQTPKSKLQKIVTIPTLWQIEKDHEKNRVQGYREAIEKYRSGVSTDKRAYQRALSALNYTLEKGKWLRQQDNNVEFELMPVFRSLHWEDDAGGDQRINQFLPWWEVTRINRKDLVAALIFGVRISIVVGIMAVSLALCIGIPIGSLSGYYGGMPDIIVCRLMEIWESMPTFFMLLLVVAMTQSKSIFIVIAVVGIFGWTGFSRYIRGEFFKHRNLPYVEACHALGFRDSYIMFSHILPNAIPPVLTLLPFAVLGAVTSEAGLSFLGLGEEGSCSWGVLMDEGRSAFPGESYLLWPPAIMLTLLLVAIALTGDAFRDALDPKMRD